MLANYVPVFFFLLLAVLIGIIVTRLGGLVRPSNPDPTKLSPYECGLEPLIGNPLRNTVPYYLFAMLFLLFDVEVLFLFPWALLYKKLQLFGLLEMLVFIGILFVGYFYAWKKGALEWRR